MKPTRYLLLIIPLACFWLSLRFIAANGWRDTALLLVHDNYLGYAESLVRGLGYQPCTADGLIPCVSIYKPEPSAARLPGEPLLLVGVLAVAGTADPLPSIRVIHALLATLTVMLATAYAARLFNLRAAFTAGAIMLLNPLMYSYSYMILSETLFGLFMLLLLHLLTFNPRRAFLIGMSVSALLLTRGAFVLTVPLLLPFIAPRRWFAFGAGMALLLLPWIARNFIDMGAFIPFSTGGGLVLYGSNNAVGYAEATGYYTYWGDQPLLEQVKTLSEVEQDRVLTDAALAFIRSQSPIKLAQMAAAKISVLLASNFLVFVVFPLALMAVLIRQLLGGRRDRRWVPARAHRPLWIMAALWLGLLLNTAIFWGDGRFRLPLDPTLAIVTGMLLFGLIRRRSVIAGD